MRGSTSAVAAAFLLASATFAQAGDDSLLSADEVPGEFSANVALATDYLFRGLSQTDEEPAIQGGFDYSVPLGEGPADFYAGVWGSNINQVDELGDTAHIEIDYYGGLAGDVQGVGWDVGVIYYDYPGTSGTLDYVEAAFALGYDFGVAAAGVGVSYSPDYFFESGDGLYVSGDVDIPLPKGLGISLHIGHQSIDENGTFGTPDYYDWKVALAADVVGFGLEFAYMDTDIDNGDCFGGTDLCDGRFVFTGSRSF